MLDIVSPNQLRVLILHDIPESEELAFELQIQWLLKHWKIITPSDFESLITGNKEVVGKNLLITFDDGLLSNRIVAEKILNRHGIKAVFFIVSDFADINTRIHAQQFIADYIIPEAKQDNISKNLCNMQLNDLKALLKQGHTIGCHSRRHAYLSNCKNTDELIFEIVTSADNLSDKLGIKIEHFAFPFGGIDSWNQDAFTVASKHYKYIYSGIRGDNARSLSPMAIRRDGASNLSSQFQYTLYDNNLLGALLNGFADFRYIKARKLIDSWH